MKALGVWVVTFLGGRYEACKNKAFVRPSSLYSHSVSILSSNLEKSVEPTVVTISLSNKRAVGNKLPTALIVLLMVLGFIVLC